MSVAYSDGLKRFAYDVIVHTLSKFKIKTVIPQSNFRENTYGHPVFLDFVCNEIILYQLTSRDVLFNTFEDGFKSYAFKNSLKISEFLMKELEKVDRKKNGRKINRSAKSLAIVNELIQFLYFKNVRLHLNDLASVWGTYFSRFRGKLDEEGLPDLHSVTLKKFKDYKTFNDFVETFIISKYCRYGQKGIWDIFNNKLDSKFSRAVEDDHKTATRSLASVSKATFSNTATSTKRLKDRKTEESGSLENTGLGIIPHEQLLQDLNDLFLYKKDSDKKSFSSIKGAVVNSGLTESPLSPPDLSKHEGCLTGSPLSPANRSKDQDSLTGSPPSLAERLKNQGARPRSSLRNTERSKDQGALTVSPLSPVERSKDRGGLPRSSLSPGERSKPTGSLTISPASPQEQNQRRSSTRTPEVISRLEQKRQKHRQRKKAEPEN